MSAPLAWPGAPEREAASRLHAPAWLPRVRTWAPPLLGWCGLAFLVFRFDAPLALGALFLLAAAVPLLLWPESATLLMVFLLYTNIPVLAYKYHGVPQAVAGAFIFLLLIPLGHHLLVRRERARVDVGFCLMLLFLVVLLAASIGARGPQVAAKHIQTYLLEGVLLYWLVINTVRDLPAVRRVVWSLLTAGSLLGGLSVYQEVSGDFRNQFGGLAHRNYEFLVLDQQFAANPDDAELRELRATMREDRSRRAEGPMDEPNAYAQIMLVLLPLALFVYRSGGSRRERVLAAAAGALILGGVLVSYSRGAFVGLVLITVLAAHVRWIRPAHLLAGTLALATLIPFVASERLVDRISSITNAIGVLQGSSAVEADAAIQGRATEMMAGFQAFVDHPVLGVGPGQYAPFYSVEYHQKNPRFKFKDLRITRRAHSLYLEMAAEVGVIGLSVFLAMFFVPMRELWRIRSRRTGERDVLAELAVAVWLSLCAYLVTGIFLHLMYERYLWILMALAGAALHAIHSQESTRCRQ